LNGKSKTILLTVCVGVAWVCTVVFGLRALLNYENAPGLAGVVPKKWPADSAVELAKDAPTLVMLAHRRCPCTRASMAERRK
jgi:hypothetical protein